MQKVLIANRGEIAVRVARACKDEGLTSVAVYAEPDRDALHVRVADEAFALGGTTPGDSYLVIDKIIEAAKQSGADAVHPGYGFLSENADFAQAVIDAGLTWIGPSPDAIIALGDKVQARHIATKAGAPLVPGTKDPVKDADEVVAFAEEHGLPVAIKAAFGGGGRGLKVARTRRRSPSCSTPPSARRSRRSAAASASSSGSWTSRGTSRRRCSPTRTATSSSSAPATARCSAATRSWSRRRPHRSSPTSSAPRIHESAKAICKEAGYHGAGTVEYLVGADGSISFLEVNTRLQVEHPVSEETAGIDLVRQQFRIAARRGAGDHRRPDAARPQHRVPDQRRGRRPQLHARPRPGHPPGDPAGPRRALGLRRRDRRRGGRRLRLDAGQADRHRRHPAAGAGARPPRPGRADRRGHADGDPVPPRRRPRRGLHQRAVHGAHPLDRDRVGQPGPALRRRTGRAGGGRRRGRPSSSRSAAAGSRSPCRPGWPRAAAGAAVPRPSRASAAAGTAARRPPATTSPRRCRARS